MQDLYDDILRETPKAASKVAPRLGPLLLGAAEAAAPVAAAVGAVGAQVAYIEHVRAGRDDDFDLGGFLDRHRRVDAAPSLATLREAVDESLRPAPLYRVVWSVATDSPEHDHRRTSPWEDF